MFRKVLVFLASSLALPVVATAVFRAWGSPPSMLVSALLILILLTAYCLGARVFRFPPRATMAGLLTGALLFNAVMIIFDWAFTHPETQSLTLEGFLRYLWLYRNSLSVAFLIAPFLLSLAAFLVGKGLVTAAARLRS